MMALVERHWNSPRMMQRTRSVIRQSNKASDAERLVAIDTALRELEGRINGDLRFVRAGPAPEAEAESTE